MATLTLPLRSRAVGRGAELAPLALGLVAVVLGWAGIGWDVAWHRLIGRDTFWTEPHLLIYTSTTLSGLAALVATATAALGRPPRAPEVRVGPLHVERGLALVGAGALAIIAAAPFDDAWHRAFGRDVDIWSPPHLFAIGGGLVVYAGWLLAATTDVFGLAPRVTRALAACFAAGLVSTVVFAGNFYYLAGWAREAFVYPLLACATLPFALALAATARGAPSLAPTLAAAAYTAFALVTFAALRLTGWPPPAFPPLVLAGALALDLARRRATRALVLGAAFAVAFVVAEWLRMLLFVPPPPTAAQIGHGVSGEIALFYAVQATLRPWTSAWPLAAIVLGAPLAAASWSLGRRVSRALSR